MVFVSEATRPGKAVENPSRETNFRKCEAFLGLGPVDNTLDVSHDGPMQPGDKRKRIGVTDLAELGRVHEDLRAAIVGLAAAKGATATPVIVALQRADLVVCRLYNEAEAGLGARAKARLARNAVEQPPKENPDTTQAEPSRTETASGAG